MVTAVWRKKEFVQEKFVVSSKFSKKPEMTAIFNVGGLKITIDTSFRDL